jgi:peroxiredoxin
MTVHHEIGVGSPVPEVPETITDASGEPRSIAEALRRGPVLLGIYKSSCQASKTLFPFLERLHQRHRGTPLTVLGVAQDSANITNSFARRQGITFPILIEPEGYPVSRAFGIYATPTIYLLLPDGTIGATTMGFFRDPVNEFGDAVAASVGTDPEPLYTDVDKEAGTPIFVPG